LHSKIKKIIGNQQGFSLVIALLSLAVLSIVGVSIISISSNTSNAAVMERTDQAVYYIAEAGLIQAKSDLSNIIQDKGTIPGSLYYSSEAGDTGNNPDFKRHLNMKTKANVTINKEVQGTNTLFQLISTGIIEGNGNATSRSVAQLLLVKNDGTIETCPITETEPGKAPSSCFETEDPGTTPEPEPGIDPDPGVDPGTIYACAAGIFETLNTTGSANFTGDIILKSGGSLSADGDIIGNLYSYGPLTIGNSIEISGNLISNSSIKITNNVTIRNNFYSKGFITISNAAKTSGSIISENGIDITNWGTTAKNIYYSGTFSAPDPNLKSISINQMPNNINEYRKYHDISKIYNGDNCIDLNSESFNFKDPNVTFPTNIETPSDTKAITFTDSKSEIYYYTYNATQDITVRLPNGDINKVYSLYLNTLNMNNHNIKVVGNGKLKIYVKDSLSLGGIIQENDSMGNKRPVYDTTVYFLRNNSNRTSPYLSNWANKIIEANLFIQNSDLYSNGSKIRGNIIVLGNNKVTLTGDNQTNGQIFYLPNSDLSLSGSVNIIGSIVAKNVTSSGNIKIYSNPY